MASSELSWAENQNKLLYRMFVKKPATGLALTGNLV
jgi:hypothetical protein